MADTPSVDGRAKSLDFFRQGLQRPRPSGAEDDFVVPDDPDMQVSHETIYAQPRVNCVVNSSLSFTEPLPVLFQLHTIVRYAHNPATPAPDRTLARVSDRPMATPHSLIRRLTLSILLPLVLLFSQQGALLHELSHWHFVSASASASESGPQAQSVDVDTDLCLTCLGFAQIGGLVKFDALPTLKLDSLSYHFATQAVRHVAELALPVARSRGPPQAV